MLLNCSAIQDRNYKALKDMTSRKGKKTVPLVKNVDTQACKRPVIVMSPCFQGWVY